ncbi:hypothetical protein IBG28_10315 [Marinomonas arctica]|uniref:Uncharacterized protein n=1 Tax=Marinomonas arctica TaxID=383750 RepID=A0A7H1JCK8_9GAMM|nr:hypothetical protein [Marinomonas arctica]MBU1297045.1 hypothetical protein [Gammaproteobacteria bacterium]MBU2239655.1 hypothetical protein [Gammaproteobacteria bacterium]MBU2413702.1 hypothetical protein [Gammaproteobacteria bacterium]QNT08221.1 hypothetical protein IBG28_16925 [Marinomonas arctica]QNT08222.1 hypothetical protein IBG28_19345 [Marinomonas arctica]
MEAYIRGVSQGVCWCEVADESVVVSKARPMKPSNGVEEKTELTNSMTFVGASFSQKPIDVAKGGSKL